MPWGAVAGAVAGSLANNLLAPSPSGSQQNTQQQMPAWMQQQYQTTIGLDNAAAGRTAQQAVSGLNSNQNQSFLNAQGQYGFGAQGMQQAQGTAGQIAGQGINPANIQNFQNPYTSQVVNSTLGQMQRQQNQQDAGINSQANQQGAFGGDRAAVATSLNDQNWTNAMGQTAASLNNQGFNTAAGLATNSAGMQLQGNQQLQNAIMGQQQLQQQQNSNLLAAGNQQQQQDQNTKNWAIQQGQIAGSALNPGVGGTVSSSGQYSGSGPGPVQGGLLGMNLGNQIGNYFQNQNNAAQQAQGNAWSGQASDWLTNQQPDLSSFRSGDVNGYGYNQAGF